MLTTTVTLTCPHCGAYNDRGYPAIDDEVVAEVMTDGDVTRVLDVEVVQDCEHACELDDERLLEAVRESLIARTKLSARLSGRAA